LLRAATGGDAAVFGEWSRSVLLESSAPAAGGLGGGGPGGGGGSGGGASSNEWNVWWVYCSGPR